MKYNLEKREYLKKHLDLDNRKNVLYICPDGIMFKYQKILYCITDKNILNIFDVSNNNYGKFEFNDIVMLDGIDIFKQKYYNPSYYHYINSDWFKIEIENKCILKYKYNIKKINQAENIIGQIENIFVSKEYPIIKVIGKYGIAYLKGE